MEYIIDKAEVRRYLGISGATDNITEALIDECAAELCRAVRPKYVYRTFPINKDGSRITLDECDITLLGSFVLKRLDGSCRCALLGATLGIEADNIMRRAQSSDMAKAVIYDACATDLIEKVCDRAQQEISDAAAKDGQLITERFSPGYGDLPLDLQKSICSVLDLGRKIGVYLTKELLLLPTKSVTALIGIGDSAKHHGRGCEFCNKRNTCRYRKKERNTL